MSSSPGDSKGTDSTLPAPVPTTAALPWAAAAATTAAPDGKKDAATPALPPSVADRPLPLADVGLAPGDRIEVKWRVHPDGDGPTYSRWWGARVVGPAGLASKGKEAKEGGADDADADAAAEAAKAAATAAAAAPAASPPPLYELVYDAHEGFEEERAVVKFLGPHRVAEASAEDKGEEGEAKKEAEEDEDDAAEKEPQLLPWRREGEAYDEPSEEEEEDDDEGAVEEEGDAAGVVSVKELQQSGALLGEREALEAEAAALSGLPADQQRAVAAGFRDYIDTFKAFVRAKMAQQQQQEGAGAGAEAGAAAEAAAAAGGAGGAGASAGGGDAGVPGEALTITAEMVAEFNAVVRNAKRARRDGGLPSVAPNKG